MKEGTHLPSCNPPGTLNTSPTPKMQSCGLWGQDGWQVSKTLSIAEVRGAACKAQGRLIVGSIIINGLIGGEGSMTSP